MTAFKVNVKWGKEVFKGVDLDTSESPEIFKAQLYTLTFVPVERQKLMIKGTTIKEEWGKAKIKNGAMFLLLGSAEELPSEPVEKTVFLEDMTESEYVSAMDLSSGLQNLGNTCYMNATVQVLKTIPELNNSLQQYKGAEQPLQTGQLSGSIAASLRELFKLMDQKTEPEINPFLLIQLFRIHYPQFAEKNDQGQFVQQDANECLLEIMRVLEQNLSPDLTTTAVRNDAATNNKSIIHKIFGVEFKVLTKCSEEGCDEPEQISQDKSLQLNCFISQEVKYLITGLNSKLKEEITKRSTTLSRDALYLRTSRISRLPGYLCIQMVRFFYKKGNINAKILKDVKFPMQLDVYDLCSDELKKKLAPMRKKFNDEEERKNEEKMQMKSKSGDANTGSKPQEPEESIADVEYERYDFENDVGSNNSGYYELQGVITHQGRSSSSGHYVGWIRKSGDKWLKCDDDNVQPVLSEDVLKLSGGGDWHIAYILLYGPRRVAKRPPPEDKVEVTESVAMEAETKT